MQSVYDPVASLVLAPLFLDCEKSLFSSNVRGEERKTSRCSLVLRSFEEKRDCSRSRTRGASNKEATAS